MAPVTTALDPLHHLAKKAVWLPEGEWVEWSTGNRFKGPQAIERNYALEDVPVFAKAGELLTPGEFEVEHVRIGRLIDAEPTEADLAVYSSKDSSLSSPRRSTSVTGPRPHPKAKAQATTVVP